MLRSLMRTVPRRAIALAGTAAAAVLLSAGIQPAAAQDKDTLRVAIWSLPFAKGNPYNGHNRPWIYAWSAMFDGITIFGEDGELQPMLADKWELVNDTTWRFTLKRGLKFQNGEEFNADALANAVNIVTSDEGKKWQLYGEMRSLQGATKVDDYTVDVTTSAPEPVLPRLFAAMRPVAPKYWADVGSKDFPEKPVGTGPFRVTEWTPDRIVMKAHMGGLRKPGTGGMIMTALPEDAARIQALLSDQVDIALGLNNDAIDEVERAGHSMSITQSTGIRVLSLHEEQADSPFRDKRVRLAANLALDREALNAAFFGGHAKPMGQPGVPASFGFDASIQPYPYDPERAKQLLAEAGYPKGFKSVAEIISSGVGGWLLAYPQVAQDLRKVGIDFELQQITLADLLNKLLGQKEWGGDAHDFDIDTLPGMDALRLRTWHSCQNPFPTKWYCNEEAQELIKKAAVETDLGKRADIIHQVMQIYHDDPAGLYLVQEADFDGINKRVQGVRIVQRHYFYDEIRLK